MNTTTLNPFPVAPGFDATTYDRRLYHARMREAWLDRADQWLTTAQEAAGAGNYIGAEKLIGDARMALTQAKLYTPEVTP